MRWFLIPLGLAVSFYVFLQNPWMEEERRPLRLAINNWPGYEALFLAHQLGYYEEEGVSIKLLQFSSLEDAKYAYERGQIDFFACTISEMLLAHDTSGRSVKVMMVPDFSNGGDVIFGRCHIRTVADLKGEKIGVEPSTLGLFLLARALELEGLTLDDVQLVALSQLGMVDQFKKGKINAVVTYPPYSIDLQRGDGLSYRVFDSSQIPGEVVDILAVDPHVIETRKEELKGVQRAWERALTYIKEEPEIAYRIMADRQGITIEEFKGTLDGFVVLNMEEQKRITRSSSLLRSIQLTQRVLYESKVLKKTVPADSFIALELLGE